MVSERSEDMVSRRAVLGTLGLAVGAGCVSSGSGSDRPTPQFEADLPAPLASLDVAWVNGGGVAKLSVTTDAAETTRTLDVRLPDGEVFSRDLPPNITSARFDLLCHRSGGFRGCTGAPYGAYLVQLRVGDDVLAAADVQLTGEHTISVEAHDG